MKKILISLLVLVVVLVGGFFAYLKFKPLSPEQSIKTTKVDIKIPKGYKPVNSDTYNHNYGGTLYEVDYDGYGEEAGISFQYFDSDNSNEVQLDVVMTSLLIHELQEIRTGEVEYHAEEPDSIDLNGIKALRYFYILKQESYDEEENAKDPRNAYKKGEAIAFFCGGRTAMITFETFEKHWDTNKEKWDAIKSGMKLKCQ